jgi:hypothetical protein
MHVSRLAQQNISKTTQSVQFANSRVQTVYHSQPASHANPNTSSTKLTVSPPALLDTGITLKYVIPAQQTVVFAKTP